MSSVDSTCVSVRRIMSQSYKTSSAATSTACFFKDLVLSNVIVRQDSNVAHHVSICFIA